MTTEPKCVAHSSVLNCDISDHDLLLCNLSLYGDSVEPIVRTYRDFANINFGGFDRDLRLISFQDIFKMDNINDKINFFNNSLLNLFDAYAPLTTRRFTKKYTPWLTDNLKFIMKLRDNAKKRYRVSQLPAHWEYYKSLRNLANKTLNLEKKAYFDYISRTKNNQELWRHLSYLNL